MKLKAQKSTTYTALRIIHRSYEFQPFCYF